MRILGIDPSSGSTGSAIGWAICEDGILIAHEAIRASIPNAKPWERIFGMVTRFQVSASVMNRVDCIYQEAPDIRFARAALALGQAGGAIGWMLFSTFGLVPQLVHPTTWRRRLCLPRKKNAALAILRTIISERGIPFTDAPTGDEVEAAGIALAGWLEKSGRGSL